MNVNQKLITTILKSFNINDIKENGIEREIVAEIDKNKHYLSTIFDWKKKDILVVKQDAVVEYGILKFQTQIMLLEFLLDEYLKNKKECDYYIEKAIHYIEKEGLSIDTTMKNPLESIENLNNFIEYYDNFILSSINKSHIPTKQCSYCPEVKPLNELYIYDQQPCCKECFIALEKEYGNGKI